MTLANINWLSSELEVDRSRAERHTSKDRLRFDGVLGASVPTLPIAATDTTVTAQSVQPAASHAVNAPSIMEQVAIRVADSGSGVTLQWSTAEMGALQIEVRREGNQVEVRILTDDASAAQLLEEHVALLSELLGEDGLELARFSAVSPSSRRADLDSERNDSENEIDSLLGVIRRASSS